MLSQIFLLGMAVDPLRDRLTVSLDFERQFFCSAAASSTNECNFLAFFFKNAVLSPLSRFLLTQLSHREWNPNFPIPHPLQQRCVPLLAFFVESEFVLPSCHISGSVVKMHALLFLHQIVDLQAKMDRKAFMIGTSPSNTCSGTKEMRDQLC